MKFGRGRLANACSKKLQKLKTLGNNFQIKNFSIIKPKNGSTLRAKQFSTLLFDHVCTVVKGSNPAEREINVSNLPKK